MNAIMMTMVFFILLAVACAPRPDYPDRETGKNKSEDVSLGKSNLRYTINIDKGRGVDTFFVYQEPGLFWVKEDCECSISSEEEVRIVSLLRSKGIEVDSENTIHDGYKLFIPISTAGRIVDKQQENNGDSITIIGGGVITDLEDEGEMGKDSTNSLKEVD
jgi:hypothetical protein